MPESEKEVETPETKPSIPLDVLPEELRGMSENEIKFFLSRTLSGVKATNETNAELKAQIAELKGRMDERPTPVVPKEKDPDDEKPLSELILENPEKAIERVAIQRGWISSLEITGRKADEALFSAVASKIDDFSEFEDDVRNIIKESNAPVNQETIARAYEMAVGKRSLAEKRTARLKDLNAEVVKPDVKPDVTLPEEGDLERTMREAHGMTREKWEKYKGDSFDVKLPTGRR
jgi:hypothetical protein